MILNRLWNEINPSFRRFLTGYTEEHSDCSFRRLMENTEREWIWTVLVWFLLIFYRNGTNYAGNSFLVYITKMLFKDSRRYVLEVAPLPVAWNRLLYIRYAEVSIWLHHGQFERKCIKGETCSHRKDLKREAFENATPANFRGLVYKMQYFKQFVCAPVGTQTLIILSSSIKICHLS